MLKHSGLGSPRRALAVRLLSGQNHRFRVEVRKGDRDQGQC